VKHFKWSLYLVIKYSSFSSLDIVKELNSFYPTLFSILQNKEKATNEKLFKKIKKS